MTAIVWFRRDLRIRDHPALEAAASGSETVVPFFCLDDRLLGGRHRSGARTQFMLEALADLDRALRELGSRLVVRRGDPRSELVSLAGQLGAGVVHAAVDAGPFARGRDHLVASALRGAGVALRGHPGVFVVDDLDAIETAAGAPYTVFTPFYRTWLKAARRAPVAAPTTLPALPADLDPGALPTLADLGLEQEVTCPAAGGERVGRAAAAGFLEVSLNSYDEGRNDLGAERASRLSPYLHLGCLSARELEAQLGDDAASEAFRRQLCWRDFYAYVLRHFPANARREHQERFRGRLRWNDDTARFEAWCDGRTGFPLVDAGMRQLRREGWMHNRARLVVGSFLTKDLERDDDLAVGVTACL